MPPLETAWSVLKADFFLGDERRSRGLHSANYNAERYKGTPVFGATNFLSESERYSPVNMHYGTGRSMATGHLRNLSDGGMPAAKVVDSPSQEPHYLGGSIPRLNPDGSFTGANVQQILNHPSIDTFEQFGQSLGDIMGHEVVHELIDPEITEWAKQQSGIMDLQDDSALRLRLELDAAFRAQMENELGPYAVEEMLGDYDREAAEHAFRTLRSMGHETGAFALTPSMTQEEIYNLMQGYPFGPYLSREDPDNISELHLAGPSPDQLRYEQLLQEQGLAE